MTATTPHRYPLVARRPAPARLASLLWTEARPVVQVVFAVRFLTGLAAGGLVAGTAAPGALLHAGAGLLVWAAMTAGVYVLNGTADLVEDRANGSTRPLARGELPEPVARTAAVAVLLVGPPVAGLVEPRLLLPAAAFAVLGWCYSRPLAGLPPLKNSAAGAALVCVAGGALTYLAGALTAGGSPRPGVVVLTAAMSPWMGVAGASKDLEDVDGDRLSGRRTLPVLLGGAAARRVIAAGTSLLVIATTVALVAAGDVALLPVGGLLVAGGTVLVLSLRRAVDVPPYRAFMTTQYLVHLTLLSVSAV